MPLEMRGAQALHLWHQVSLALVRNQSQDLSARQLTILLSVYLTPPPHTVKGLAETMNVAKPAITRALDALSAQKLIARRRDAADKRNVLIKRTVQGATYLENLSELVLEKARELPR
ncbi:MarR family transcriptional regulator [Polycladidibacter hongkongensis]|uniref:MarR family transcriptional regulator n=1 Tax=Polycladidibacter hongkongensis TaxID=1647556 RepID=UPI0008357AAB|nr:MarR family transcriptional regulator [Pseudovibrio hongkongensis]